jgi:hypothetical protein
MPIVSARWAAFQIMDNLAGFHTEPHHHGKNIEIDDPL